MLTREDIDRCQRGERARLAAMDRECRLSGARFSYRFPVRLRSAARESRPSFRRTETNSDAGAADPHIAATLAEGGAA